MLSLLLPHRFKFLLTSLLVIILFSPLLADGIAFVSIETGQLVIFLLSACVLLAATLAVSGKKGIRIFALCLVVPALLLELIGHFFWPGNLMIIHHVIRLMFFAFVIGNLLRYLFHARLVTFDTLCASLCVYLLIGVMWQNAYGVIEILAPGSYISTSPQPGSEDRASLNADAIRSLRFLFFSFSNLTTTTAGDLAPATNFARMVALIEAIVGQSYLLIMVSRLVGLHVSQTLPPADNHPAPAPDPRMPNHSSQRH